MANRLLLLLLPCFVFANPKDGNVTVGECSLKETGKTLTVHQNSDKSVIEWNSFSVGELETTRFVFSSDTGAVLNRVMGKEVSELNGLLQGNGNVFLINPNGVVIGPKGRIDTHSFVGSTLDLVNEQFLKNTEYTFTGERDSDIINYGQIETLDDVFLIGRNVKNHGRITSESGNVGLMGGSEVFLSDQKKGLIVRVKGEGSIENNGLIEAVQVELQSSSGNISELAINQKGVIRANTIGEKDGKILLYALSGTNIVDGEMDAGVEGTIHVLGDYVQLLDGANLHTDGGEILIGGDCRGENDLIPNAKMCFVGKNARIDASSLEGNGGKVIFWGDHLNYFYGSVKAEGGSTSGNGGFVEISSLGDFQFFGEVSTFAPYGNNGSVLFDPIDLTISGGANTNVSTPFPPPPPAVPNPFIIGFSASPAVINNVALQNALSVNDVVIDVSGAGAGTGIVTITSPIAWATDQKLTIITPRNIAINADVTNTGTGGVDVMDFQANVGGAVTGDFDGIGTADAVTISATSNNIRMEAVSGTSGGNVGIAIEENASVGATILSTTSGDITLIGTGKNAAGGSHPVGSGVFIDSTGITRTTVSTMTGTITITGTNTNAVPLTQRAGVGVRRSDILVNDGNLIINGDGQGPGGLSRGFDSFAGLIAATTGNITINANTLDNQSFSLALTTSITATSGDITINATSTMPLAGNGGNIGVATVETTAGGNINYSDTSALGLDFPGVASKLGGPGTGDITLTVNSMTYSGGNTNVYDGMAGSIFTVQPLDPTTTIGVGGGAGTFNPDTIIDHILEPGAFSQVVIGRPDQNSVTNIDTWPIIHSGTAMPLLRALHLRNSTVNIGASVDMNGLDFTATIGTGGAGGAFNLNNNLLNATGTNTVIGANAPASNTFNAANNTTNTWDITGNNAGSFMSSGGFNFGFTNVGTIVGGNLADTVNVGDGFVMEGQIDGGAPAAANTLDYSAWTTDPFVVMNTPTSGDAINLNTAGLFAEGWVNFGTVIVPSNLPPPVVVLAVTNTIAQEVQTNASANVLIDRPFRDFQRTLLGVLNKFYLLGEKWALVNNILVNYAQSGFFDLQNYSYEQRYPGLERSIQPYNYNTFFESHL